MTALMYEVVLNKVTLRLLYMNLRNLSLYPPVDRSGSPCRLSIFFVFKGFVLSDLGLVSTSSVGLVKNSSSSYGRSLSLVCSGFSLRDFDIFSTKGLFVLCIKFSRTPNDLLSRNCCVNWMLNYMKWNVPPWLVE